MTRFKLLWPGTLPACAALCAAAMLPGAWMQAPGQMHKVAKPEQVVRAVGVYEWTGDLAKPAASRLIPVSLFIDDHLEDAGIYLARPVPFALDTGTVYEIDQAGVPRGTLDLEFARHLVATGDAADVSNNYDDGWFGYGAFHGPPKPHPVVLKKPAKPAVAGKPKATGDSDRPTFARRPAESSGSTSGSGSGTATNTTAAPAGGSASGSAPDAPDDDPDRPKFAKRPPAPAASGTPDAQTTSTAGSTGASTPATGTGTVPADDPDRPTLKKRTPAEARQARKESEQSNVQGATASLNDDPDRPRLERGRPAHPVTSAGFSTLKGLPTDLHQMVAVSDAKTRDTHDFARPWEDDSERVAILGKLETTARAQIAAYDAQQTAATKAQVASSDAAAAAQSAAGQSATPSAKADSTAHNQPNNQPHNAASGSSQAGRSSASRRRSAAAKTPAPLTLEEEELKGYTLSYGGAATFVYSAHTAGSGAALRYVTVVAQMDALGALKPAIESVTDAAHLDRTPRMRLVDVVDAEASNRASILFELRGEDEREFALYRVIAARSEQIFLTGTTQ